MFLLLLLKVLNKLLLLAASVQYVKMRPAVLPAVTAAAVRFTVAVPQTAAGLVMVTEGAKFMVIVPVVETFPQPPVSVTV